PSPQRRRNRLRPPPRNKHSKLSVIEAEKRAKRPRPRPGGGGTPWTRVLAALEAAPRPTRLHHVRGSRAKRVRGPGSAPAPRPRAFGEHGRAVESLRPRARHGTRTYLSTRSRDPSAR